MMIIMIIMILMMMPMSFPIDAAYIELHSASTVGDNQSENATELQQKFTQFINLLGM